jgi:hypothetical protein
MAGKLTIVEKGVSWLKGSGGPVHHTITGNVGGTSGVKTVKLKIPASNATYMAHERAGSGGLESYGPGATLTLPAGEAVQLIAHDCAVEA